MQKLIKAVKDDTETLDLISSCLKSFDDYHAAIYKMETWAMIYNHEVLGREEYRDTFESLDKSRSYNHNDVIGNIRIINRMAQNAGVGLIYDGTVSEEPPHRREIADAVLKFVNDVVLNRR